MSLTWWRAASATACLATPPSLSQIPFPWPGAKKLKNIASSPCCWTNAEPQPNQKLVTTVVRPQGQKFDTTVTISFTFVVIDFKDGVYELRDLFISLPHVRCNTSMWNTRDSTKLVIPKVDYTNKKNCFTPVVVVRLVFHWINDAGVSRIVHPLDYKTICWCDRLHMNFQLFPLHGLKLMAESVWG